MKNMGEELIQDMKNQLHQQKYTEWEEKEVIYLYYSLEELNELLGTGQGQAACSGRAQLRH